MSLLKCSPACQNLGQLYRKAELFCTQTVRTLIEALCLSQCLFLFVYKPREPPDESSVSLAKVFTFEFCYFFSLDCRLILTLFNLYPSYTY